MKEKGDTLKKAHLFNEMNCKISGGTLYTVFESIKIKQQNLPQSIIGYDPILKLIGDNKKSLNNTQIIIQKMLSYSNLCGDWTSVSLGASVNALLIKRSNALLGYNQNLIYEECTI